jgi:hypothetical protein
MRVIVTNLPAEHGGDSSGHSTEITTTITGVSLDSIPDSQFTLPADFKETKLPDLFGKTPTPSVSPGR